MKSVSCKEMKKLDCLAVGRYGIPSLILMENAGRSAAQEALGMLSGKVKKSAAIFCGYGNNGGDGFVCCRHLINKGVKTVVYLAGKGKDFSPEAGTNYRILRRMKQEFKTIRSRAAVMGLKKEIKKYSLVIDAIFGIGLRGKPDTFYRELFEAINDSGARVLALDVPSGLDADTGEPLGTAVKAAKTVTFGLLKDGLAKKRALKFTGEITVADISLPRNSKQ